MITQTTNVSDEALQIPPSITAAGKCTVVTCLRTSAVSPAVPCECWANLPGHPVANSWQPLTSLCLCVCPTVNATASNITPPAQYLTQNGAVVTVNNQPVLLFQPVVQVWGYYAQDLVSGPTATAATTSTATRRLHQDNSGVFMDTPQSSSTQEGYINQYYFVPANSSQSTFPVASGELQEGYYRLSAKVSVMTVLPNLVDSQGMAIINQVCCWHHGCPVEDHQSGMGVLITGYQSMPGICCRLLQGGVLVVLTAASIAGRVRQATVSRMLPLFFLCCGKRNVALAWPLNTQRADLLLFAAVATDRCVWGGWVH